VEMVDAGGRGQENVEMRGCWMEERWLKFINWMPPTMREIRLAEKGCQVNMDGMS